MSVRMDVLMRERSDAVDASATDSLVNCLRSFQPAKETLRFDFFVQYISKAVVDHIASIVIFRDATMDGLSACSFTVVLDGTSTRFPTTFYRDPSESPIHSIHIHI